MSLNCGKACGSIGSFSAVLDTVSASVPDWGVCFFAEVDGYLDHRLPLTGRFTYRHWPGAGSWAMLLHVRRDLGCLVQNLQWKGRCGAVHLMQRPSGEFGGINLWIIFVHSAHGDLQDDTLSDLSFCSDSGREGRKH